jgi:chemotaxis protein MotB
MPEETNKVVDMALPPIIIIRKKKMHAAHHGGAWKVAYADFVTGMMALFIVLWLLNSNQDVRKAIGGYFLDPKGVGAKAGSAMAGTGSSLTVSKSDLAQLKDRLAAAIQAAPELSKLKSQVEMIITGEGLRIELMDSEKGEFFQVGLPMPTPLGKEMISLLASELGKLQNRLIIEGHTDSVAFVSENGYSNWELSSDRANAARRLMETSGLHGGQISEIRGFADQRLRKPGDPKAFANRRVSMIVQYIPVAEKPDAEEKGGKKPAGEHGGKEGKSSEKKESKPAAKSGEKH